MLQKPSYESRNQPTVVHSEQNQQPSNQSVVVVRGASSFKAFIKILQDRALTPCSTAVIRFIDTICHVPVRLSV